jgi:hypothetical protein
VCVCVCVCECVRVHVCVWTGRVSRVSRLSEVYCVVVECTGKKKEVTLMVSRMSLNFSFAAMTTVCETSICAARHEQSQFRNSGREPDT